MEVSGKLHTLATLPTRKGPVVLSDSRLGGSQSQCRHVGEGKKSLPCQESNLSHPACSLVTTLNEVPWFSNAWVWADFLCDKLIMLNIFVSLCILQTLILLH